MGLVAEHSRPAHKTNNCELLNYIYICCMDKPRLQANMHMAADSMQSTRDKTAVKAKAI